MAATKQFSNLTRCMNCHTSALNRFLGLAGLTYRHHQSARPKLQSLHSFRTYSRSGIWRTESPRALQPAEQEQEQDQYQSLQENTEQELQEEIASSQEEPEGDPDDSTPWYIRDQPQRPPLWERQKLPDIPGDAPNMLKPILEHLSTDIGLESMTLFDVRKLDPPPPLGANLIMVIGTARSDRHLYISAERFCHWLRKRYELSPRADGLLGRNQIKRILRRKTRKAKLIKASHTVATEAKDDGLANAWICVNVGYIEKRGFTQERSLEEEGIVGFGSTIDGTQLVVQMMTEGKREEIDLETLWNGYLTRQMRRDNDASRSDEPAQKYEDRSRAQGDDSLRESSEVSQTLSKRHQQRFDIVNSQYEDYSNASVAQDLEPLEHIRPPEHAFPRPPPDQDSETLELHDAQVLLDSLKDLDAATIRRQLGTGFRDKISTFFLRSFHCCFSPRRDLYDWQRLLQLRIIGMQAEHPVYPNHALHMLINWRRDHYSGVAQSILEPLVRPIVQYMFKQLSSSAEDPVLAKQVKRVLWILKTMCKGGLPVFESDVCEALYLLTIQARTLERRAKASINPNEPTEENSFLQSDNAVWFLTRYFDNIDVHPRDPHFHARVLEALAAVGDWTEYWRYWRGIARRMEARPASLYSAMFRQAAMTNHQRQCCETLDEWIPEMETEEPPVKISGDLAKSIMRCVHVADPAVISQLRNGDNENGQWVRLWRKCEQSLEEGLFPDELDKIRRQFEALVEDSGVRGAVKLEGETKSVEEQLDDL